MFSDVDFMYFCFFNQTIDFFVYLGFTKQLKCQYFSMAFNDYVLVRKSNFYAS